MNPTPTMLPVPFQQIVALAYCHVRNDFGCIKNQWIDSQHLSDLLNARYKFADCKSCDSKQINSALAASKSADKLGAAIDSHPTYNKLGHYKLVHAIHYSEKSVGRHRHTFYNFADSVPDKPLDWKKVVEQSAALIAECKKLIESTPRSSGDKVNEHIEKLVIKGAGTSPFLSFANLDLRIFAIWMVVGFFWLLQHLTDSKLVVVETLLWPRARPRLVGRAYNIELIFSS
jgi:hypothetical protein